uniref:Carboxypeptidase regulatory-like domain-containing protein n=1 Tax=Thermus islandicus TaxID=540988 RepID=A0A7C2FUT6_9DEIN
MRLLSVLPLLALALAARPGEALVLPFPGLPPGPLEVASDLPLLLAPRASDGGVVLVAVEVPPRLPPGTYRVCLRQGSGLPACREVAVEALPRLAAQVPREVAGRSLRLALKNEGNVPLSLHLAPEEGSEVLFPPMALSLAPGEEREVVLPLFGFGFLRLALLSEGRKEVYLVRARPEGGLPLPYALAGLLEGGYASGVGAFLRFALEGSVSREARLALALEGPAPALRAGVEAGGVSAGLKVGEKGVEEARLGLRGGPWKGQVEYPPALEVGYSGEALFRLRLSPEALSAGLADGTWALSGALPFARPEGLSLKLERYGDPHLYARLEGGAYLGLASGGWQGEGGLSPSGPVLRLGYTGGEGGFAYALRAGYQGGPTLGLQAGYARPPFAFTARLELGSALAFGLGVGYREAPFALGLDLSPSGLSGFLEWREAPYALRLEGRRDAGGLRFGLFGSYAFRLPVPEGLTLALGGYEEVPLEGRVELLGRPVRGARVEGGLAPVETDGEGRFRLYAPRSGVRLRALPPKGVLALPAEASWRPGDPPPVLALRPASALRLRCEGGGRGAYLVGEVGAFVPCGGRAVLPPGAYRLTPEALPGFRAEEREGVLRPLAEEEVLLAFAPLPVEALPEARPLRVEWPLGVAPGEVARVRVRGASPGEVSLSLPVLKAGRQGDDLVLLFQVPWEAEGSLLLEVRHGEKREGRLVPVSPKPLLALRLDPARARVGEEVEVRVEALFPAEEAFLALPNGALLPLAPLPEEGRWAFVGRFRVEEGFLGRAEALSPSLLALPLKARARQGERWAEVEARLLVLPGGASGKP